MYHLLFRKYFLIDLRIIFLPALFIIISKFNKKKYNKHPNSKTMKIRYPPPPQKKKGL